MYKLLTGINAEVIGVAKTDANISIPFASDNTDYQAFKKAVNEGADLEDADGDLMTAEQAKEYVATLP
jgi:hypothetical protein